MNAQPKIRITKIFTFDSAHQLPNNEIYGKCRFLHGHTYKLEITVEGHINEFGWVIDFKELKRIVNENIIEPLDHHFLNDFVNVSTAENLCLWIWNRLFDKFPEGVNLVSIKLFETPTSYAEFSGNFQ